MKTEDRLDDDQNHEDDGDASGKRRRVQRACDVCRKKKIRCDGLQPEKGACSNCASYGHECTFADAVKRRAPPRSYVIALEARMEKAEETVRQLAPYLDLDKVIGPMPVLPSDKKEGEEDSPSLGPSADHQIANFHPSRQASDQSYYDDAEAYEGDDDEDAAYIQMSLDHVTLDEQMPSKMVARVSKKAQTTQKSEVFRIDSNVIGFNETTEGDAVPQNDEAADAPIFLGRASNFHILPLLEKMSQSSKTKPSTHSENNNPPDMLSGMMIGSPQENEKDRSNYDFAWPEPDLQQKLINAYFGRHNRDMPILNEIVTRKMLSKPVWEWNDTRTLLIALGVFSIATRYLEDDRLVRPDGLAAAVYWHKTQRILLSEEYNLHGTSIFFIQATLLSIIYASAAPKSTFIHAWVSLSVVVRMLEDCGAHRKFTAQRLGWTLLTEETYKRLWWVTYVLDRQLSADLGRPMAIQDEDFDLDEILLVDDEYIYQASENRTEPVQPLGKTCYYEGFLQTTRLSQVIGRTLRTIYAISKSKISRGFVGKKWDTLVVADIDKSLNKWLEGVPSYLRYNANDQDVELLLQSSRIFVQYYYTQTLIHRPFIQSEKLNNSDLTFKSLAIVSNAARSAIHIMHNLLQRGLMLNANPDFCFRSFGFGCMLIFISWSAYSNNLRVSQSIMADVGKVLEIFQSLKSRHGVAVNMSMMLQIIIKRSALPISGTPSIRQASKRGFEEESGTQQHQQQLSSNNDNTTTSDRAAAVTEAAARDIRNLPTVCGSARQLPLSTIELQSVFSSSDSPESNNADIPSMSQYFSSSSSRPSSYSTSSADQTANRQSEKGFGMSDWNQKQQQWSQHQQLPQQSQLQPPLQQASPPPSFSNPTTSFGSTFNNPIDSTIFDPTNRTLDTFLSGRMPSTNAFDMFGGTPGGSNLFGNSSNIEGTNGGNGDDMGSVDPQGLGGTTLGDPLDALVNMQSMFSDADWMRALDHQTG